MKVKYTAQTEHDPKQPAVITVGMPATSATNLNLKGTDIIADVEPVSESWSRVHFPQRLPGVRGDYTAELLPIETDPKPKPFKNAFNTSVPPDKLLLLESGNRFYEIGLEEEYRGHLVHRYRGVARIGPVFVELVLEHLSRCNYMRGWLLWGASTPSTEATSFAVESVRLVTPDKNARFHIQGNGPGRGLESDDKKSLELVQPASILNEGKAKRVHFLLTDGDVEGSVCQPMGLLASWAGHVAGPHGILPGPIETAVEPKLRGVPMDWNDGGTYICRRRPADPGNQEDFGILRMLSELWHGRLDRLSEIRDWVYQEARRPTHRRQEDGSRDPLGKDPDTLLWSGMPDERFSRRMLGKTARLPVEDGWYPHDMEHWSINHLAEFAMLTGDIGAWDEVDHHGDLLLGEAAVDSYHEYANQVWAARAEGRVLHALCWVYFLTGRADVGERIHARVRNIEEKGGLDHEPPIVRLRSPDPRKLEGRHSWWAAWEEAIAAAGLDAAAKTVGSSVAGDISDMVAATVIRHGIVADDNGRLAATTAVSSGDASVYQIETDLNRWTLPAAAIFAGLGSGGRFNDEDIEKAFEVISQFLDITDYNSLSWVALA